MAKQNLLAGLISSIVFLFLFLVLKWNVFVSLIFAVAIFSAVYLLTKPIRKIGNIELENLVNGLELHELFKEANFDLETMKDQVNHISDPSVKEKVTSLAGVGQDILNYLEENPKEISKSRHFLEYYFETAKRIVINYVKLAKANISESKFSHITEKTIESLQLLDKVFVNQRDGYHEDKLMALEVENDLLEKTIKLGGELK